MEQLISFAWLGLALIMGRMLRGWIPALRRAFIPSSIIGGMLLLLIGPEVLGRLAPGLPPVVTGESVAIWSGLPGFLINIVFALTALVLVPLFGVEPMFGVLTGIVLVNWGVKQGHTRIVRTQAEAEDDIETAAENHDTTESEIAPHGQSDDPKAMVQIESMEPMTFHLAYIGASIGVGAIGRFRGTMCNVR